MPEIEFLLANESRVTVNAEAGQNIMKVAVNNDIPGVIGECGGEMSCATCHVLDLQPDDGLFGPASEDELDVLSTLDDEQPTSRLGCQLRMPAVECIRLAVPES